MFFWWLRCKPLKYFCTWRRLVFIRWESDSVRMCVWWGLLEQSALYWVTLLNSAHTSWYSHTRTCTQPEAWGMQTHNHAHMLKVVHADTHKRAHPVAEDRFCHWCLSTDINHGQAKCLCVLLMLAGLQRIFILICIHDYVLVLHRSSHYHCKLHIILYNALHLIQAETGGNQYCSNNLLLESSFILWDE